MLRHLALAIFAMTCMACGSSTALEQVNDAVADTGSDARQDAVTDTAFDSTGDLRQDLGDMGMDSSDAAASPEPNRVCLADSQCPDEQVCVGLEPCTFCTPILGHCMDKAPPGRCWSNDDCGTPPQVCIDPLACRGGEVCLVEERPGICLALMNAHCYSATDCPYFYGDGTQCLCTGSQPFGTADDPTPVPGFYCSVPADHCMEDNDCPFGKTCEGVVAGEEICPADFPNEGFSFGTCQPGPNWVDGTCLYDQECAQGERCIGEWVQYAMKNPWSQQHPGLCLPIPDPESGQCYSQLDCPDATECRGAWVCNVLAGEMCGGTMATPGTCTPIAFPTAGNGELCDPSGVQCDDGLACCMPCGAGECPRTCETPCDEGEPGCSGGCWMYP